MRASGVLAESSVRMECFAGGTPGSTSGPNLGLFSRRSEIGCPPLDRPVRLSFRSGRSVAWLARLLGVQEVESSNLSAPTIFPTVLRGKSLHSKHCYSVCYLRHMFASRPVESPKRSSPVTPMRSARLRNRLLAGFAPCWMKRPGVSVPPPPPARTIGRLSWE
jgi:hypothetical protein